MKKKIIKFFITIYIRTVNIFRRIKIPTNKSFYKVPINEFAEKINSMPYKSDLLKGAIDTVADPDKFFDIKRKHGRDCDDFARQWSLYGILNGYVSKEWIVCNPIKPFATMHVVTTISKPGATYLCNYYPYLAKSEQDALSILTKYSYDYDEMVLVFSREIKKRS